MKNKRINRTKLLKTRKNLKKSKGGDFPFFVYNQGIQKPIAINNYRAPQLANNEQFLFKLHGQPIQQPIQQAHYTHLKYNQDALKANQAQLKARQDALKARQDALIAQQKAQHQAAQQKAQQDALKAQQDALKAQQKAQQDALKAQQKAAQQKAQHQAAQQKAQQDALKAQQKAQQDALKARQAQQKAQQDALNAQQKAQHQAAQQKRQQVYVNQRMRPRMSPQQNGKQKRTENSKVVTREEDKVDTIKILQGVNAKLHAQMMKKLEQENAKKLAAYAKNQDRINRFNITNEKFNKIKERRDKMK